MSRSAALRLDRTSIGASAVHAPSAFARASNAVAAAVDAQARLVSELPWLAVRMAVRTGEAQLRDEGNYVGRPSSRCRSARPSSTPDAHAAGGDAPQTGWESLTPTEQGSWS